ncbi:MAG: metal-dependent hydrolase [Candidatus Woesearchaeota archaeon]
MMFITHLLFSLMIGLLLLRFDVLSFIGTINEMIFFFMVVIGGVISDLDQPRSKVGKELGIFSKIINFSLGHRGFVHSIIFGLVISALFYLLNTAAAAGFLIGFLGHVLLDSMTKEGIVLFRPICHIRIKGICHTGGLLESIGVVFLYVFLVFLMVGY